jgi:hypothetical protein
MSLMTTILKSLKSLLETLLFDCMTEQEKVNAQQIAQEFWAMVEREAAELRSLLITILKNFSVRDTI